METTRTPWDIWARVLDTTTPRLATHPDYEILTALLLKYYRARVGWDEFIAAQKVPEGIRALLARLIIELKRHGYGIFGSVNGEIRHCYLTDTAAAHKDSVHRAPAMTRCDLCDRECTRKDFNGVHRKGIKRCWEEK